MKIKWGALVVEGRGKLNGNVASRNRAGAYLRTKVSPVNPSTTAQAEVRNRLGGLSQAWRGLTAAAIASWNNAVSSFAKTDIFGDLKNPSGFNLFVRLNSNLLNVGESQLSTPPLPDDIAALTGLSVTAETGTESFEVTFAPAADADVSYLVFATAPQSPGKSFVKSEYRQIAVIASGDTSPIDLLSEYQAVFGSTGAEEGQKIFVKLVPISLNSGQSGVALSASTITTASV